MLVVIDKGARVKIPILVEHGGAEAIEKFLGEQRKVSAKLAKPAPRKSKQAEEED